MSDWLQHHRGCLQTLGPGGGREARAGLRAECCDGTSDVPAGSHTALERYPTGGRQEEGNRAGGKYGMSEINNNIIIIILKCLRAEQLSFNLSNSTLKLGSVLLFLEGLPSEAEPEPSRLSAMGLPSDALEAGWPLAVFWPVGLCPVLSSKVIERTARLVGCGLARGFGLGEEGCKYTA